MFARLTIAFIAAGCMPFVFGGDKAAFKCNNMPADPDFGYKKCYGEGEIGTYCTFHCHQGYEKRGTYAVICHYRKEGAIWSGVAPVCEPVCKPLPGIPQNGQRTCEGSGEIGSLCKFGCDYGFRMEGPKQSACAEDGDAADWETNSPTCQMICEPLPREPKDGNRMCEGNGDLGTTCTFFCDDGFEMKGAAKTTCQKMGNRAGWNNQAPTCLPRCRGWPEKPENGQMECEGNGKLGTICKYKCDKSHRLDGPSEIVCEGACNAGWSEKPPVCTPLCEPMPTDPDNGSKFCNGHGEIGTVCKFECDGGYELVGDDVECKKTKTGGKWSGKFPTCEKPPKCDPMPKAPENGDKICDGDGELGTICLFRCKGKYRIEGYENTKCIRKGTNGADWSHPTPKCKIVDVKPKCPHLPDPYGGKWECTKEDRSEGTICKLKCKGSYEILPEEIKSTNCSGTFTKAGKITLKWTQLPCCSECAPPKKDIVIVIDSSDSIHRDEWKTVKTFVANLIRKFEVSKDAVQFAVVVYGTFPAGDGIRFGKSKTELLNAVKNLNKKGGYTYTGDALAYTREKILKSKKNRKDVDDMVWVITDGSADDFDKTRYKAGRTVKIQSRLLRKAGTEILAIAVDPSDDFMSQMTAMTKNPDNILKAKNIADLTGDLVDKINKKICVKRCIDKPSASDVK